MCNPNQITEWKAEPMRRAAEVLATAAEKREAGPDVKTLDAEIAQLSFENSLVAQALIASSMQVQSDDRLHS